MHPATPYQESKPRYEILDGLRGVAAVLVVAFHLFEAHSGGNHLIQVINHGYLAVDFFFLLSGFVIGYAYDDRWGRMTVADFLRRRLVRLHPMVIMGSLIGGVCYYFGASTLFPMIHDMPVWHLVVVMLVGCTLLPLTPALDIRGWQEMHPLNGPAWSLFFEYIANFLYAVVIRKLPRLVLAALVVLFGCALLRLALAHGDVIGGWAVNGPQLRIGFTRLLYPFFAGLLLFRTGKLFRFRHAFWVCSVLIVALLALPRFGGADHPWANGLYEALVILFAFPLIVALGAGSRLEGRYSTKICTLLGEVSYPLYITHYPLIYLYTACIVDRHWSLRQSYPLALLVLFGAIAIAYACVKLYDEPVRNRLKARFLTSR